MLKKSLILFFWFFISLPSLKAEECYCGTVYDSQVDEIGDKICETLVEMEIFMPPQIVTHVFDVDDDDEKYEETTIWKPSPHGTIVYNFSSWECEYDEMHDFCEVGPLSSPADTFLLLESISDQIQRYRDHNELFVKEELNKLDISFYIKKRIREEEYVRDRANLLPLLLKYEEKGRWFDEKLNNLEVWVRKAYDDIFTKCLEIHNNDTAYYHRGFMALARGDFFTAMLELKKIENLEKLSIEEQIESKYQLGKTQNLLALYDDAINALTEAIEADPKKREAYFERAIAYFEKGEFDKAIKDYIQSDSKTSSISERALGTLEFAGGLVMGVTHGGAEAIENFGPSVLSSLRGLANGVWAFACDPKDVSKEMVETGKELYNFIQDKSALETLRVLIPEIDHLIGDWKQHSEFRKGELIGTIIGKYSTDFCLFAGSVKALKLYEELRIANAALTFNTLRNLEKQGQLLEKSTKWHKATASEIKEIRKKALDLSAKYSQESLTENQARKLLHTIGVKTHPIPKGLNLNEFTIKISDKGGGIRYISKRNSRYEIRVMPGNPLSEYPCQRRPYVVHQNPSGMMDKAGKIVHRKNEASHIPLKEYDFKIFEKALENEK